MSPATKSLLKALWNLAILGFAAFAIAVIGSRLPRFFADSHDPGALGMGLQGAGLLAMLLASTLSLLSPFWFKTPPWLRLAFALLLGVFIAGAIVADHLLAQNIWAEHQFNLPDHALFFGLYLLFTAPHLLLARGYPALLSPKHPRPSAS